MRNILLALLTASLLIFSGINCMTAATPANATAIPNLALEKEGDYLGMSVLEVMKKLGAPDSTGRCQILLPIAGEHLETDMRVMGDGAMYTEVGQDEKHVIQVITQLCAVNGIVVSQQITIADRMFVEGEAIFTSGYTDYVLLRQVLRDGPDKEGKEDDGDYILQPGELAI